MTKEQITQSIYDAIDQVNEDLPTTKQLEKTLETALFGKYSSLDSLDLVDLILTIEQSLEDTFRVSLTLADEKALSEKSSPFRTVNTLSDYIYKLLEDNKRG